MKYGVILFNYEETTERTAGYNLGDSIQTLAVLNLYKKMGINNDDVVFVGMNHLKDYDGEYVLLPIIGVPIMGEYAPPYSDRIVPVFLSSHFAYDDLDDEQIQYLKTYAPVGCRDEYSLNTMRMYNIPSYLSGCITVLFENDFEYKRNNKIYAIDLPEYIKNEVSEKFKGKEVIFDTQLLPFFHEGKMNMEDAMKFLEIAKNRLREYANSDLVITSRLHALVPSMALGAPVIGVFENLSYRFSWIDKLIHLYTEEDVGSIDWQPEKIVIPNKKEIEELYESVIRKNFDKYSMYYELSEFYENREKSNYGNRYRNILKSFFKNEENFSYIIFGCGLIGSNVYRIMKEEYPKAELSMAIDNYVVGPWKGTKVVKQSEVYIIERLGKNCYSNSFWKRSSI